MNYSEQYLTARKQEKYSHIVNEVKIYTQETLKFVGIGIAAFVLIIIAIVIIG